MKDIYVNKDGIICACTVPFPNEKDFSGDQWKENAALQACKASAVPFDEKFSITVLLIDSFKDTSGKTMHEVMKDKIKPDTFYQIEADWEIFTECECLNFDPKIPCALNDKHCKGTKFARLKVPAPTVATDNSGHEDCTFYLMTDVAVYACECDPHNIQIGDQEYTPVLSGVEYSEKLLGDFLNYVEDKTYFFEDKDVTVDQVVNAYLDSKSAVASPVEEEQKTAEQWLGWLDKRCHFTSFQSDYVLMVLKELTRKKDVS